MGALGIASLALASWEMPRTEILSAVQGGGQCPLPRIAKVNAVVQPDHQLLLFMFGLSQGMRP